MGIFNTTNFFDKPAVINAIGLVQANVLSKSGALLRKIAQRSMRYRKNKSAPAGSPPFAHKPKAFLRQFLTFSYDPNTKSVVVGPENLGKNKPAGNVQEFGGASVIKNPRRKIRKIGDGGEVRLGGKAGKTSKRVGGIKTFGNANNKTFIVTYAKIKNQKMADRANRIQDYLYGPIEKTVTVAPHPFMAPALAGASPKLAPMWRNAVVKS